MEGRHQSGTGAGLGQHLPEFVNELAFRNAAHSFQGADGAFSGADGQGHELGHRGKLSKHELFSLGDALFQEEIPEPHSAECAQDRSDHDDRNIDVSLQNETDAEYAAEQNTEHREDDLFGAIVDHRFVEARAGKSTFQDGSIAGEGRNLVRGPGQCLSKQGTDEIVTAGSIGSDFPTSVQGRADVNHPQLRSNPIGETGCSHGSSRAEQQPHSSGQYQGNENPRGPCVHRRTLRSVGSAPSRSINR